MTDSRQELPQGYLHGYSPEEQDRLARQARYLEHAVHDRLPFRRSRRLIEIGSGVGAQTEILLRHFPELHVTGVDRSEANGSQAKARLGSLDWASGRWAWRQADAESLPFPDDEFDAAFLCWGPRTRAASGPRSHRSPARPPSGSTYRLHRTAQNATFFIDPYSPATLAYWMAFNDYQFEELQGDPFVGAKLGNLLQCAGFSDITTEVKTFHLDNRAPDERAEFIAFWAELLLSGAPGLVAAGKVAPQLVEQMKVEFTTAARDPNAVFFYSFVQAPRPRLIQPPPIWAGETPLTELWKRQFLFFRQSSRCQLGGSHACLTSHVV